MQAAAIISCTCRTARNCYPQLVESADTGPSGTRSALDLKGLPSQIYNAHFGYSKDFSSFPINTHTHPAKRCDIKVPCPSQHNTPPPQ